YVAGPDNPNFLGPTSHADLVQQLLASEGDSGTNRDYVLKLSAALEAMGRSDPHVADLAAAVSLGRVRAGDAPT
ncbi:MAG: gamma-glutamylcyclotransferase, partial [Myxococcota bacterium]|nr:gamma-glutamylcyclotransferase [Myxococcota bacterium]